MGQCVWSQWGDRLADEAIIPVRRSYGYGLMVLWSQRGNRAQHEFIFTVLESGILVLIAGRRSHWEDSPRLE
jgi:hypothetical protein